MSRRIFLGLAVIFCILIFLSLALAQQETNLGNNLEDKYDELYNKERFATADTNQDGALDKNELMVQEKDFEYYHNNERFRHADTNNDGMLNLQETRREKRWENEHYEKLHKDAFEDLKKKHPGIDFKDVNWLKEHPEVSKELFKNRYWLKQHSHIAEQLCAQKEWLNNHPEAAKEIYQNRHFLTRHPRIAQRLYENKEFLNKHPELSKRIYRHREWLGREDRRDRKKNVHDLGQHKGYEKGVRDHGKGIGRGKGQGAVHKQR